jgi:hypothetical protein
VARPYALLIALVAWLALIGQYYLMVRGQTGSEFLFRTVNFFSYFTILSNIMVALVTTATAVIPRSAPGRLLMRPGVASAVALYIGVTGIIYFSILRHLWEPEGMAFVVDAALHYVTPVLYLIFWLFVVIKGKLTVDIVGKMLVFPTLYAVYSLIRGPFAKWYPYPFLDAGQYGYGQVAINIVGVIILFSVFALILFGIDRVIGRMRGVVPEPREV